MIWSHSQIIATPLENNRYLNVICPNHIHSEIETVICIKGKTGVSVNGKSYILSAGECAYISPFDIHSYFGEKGECRILVFRPDVTPAFYEFSKGKTAGKVTFMLNDSTFKYICNISAGNYELIEAQGIAAPVCSEIVKKCEFFGSNKFNDSILSDALLYIEKNSSEDLSLEKVSKIIGCNSASLSRTFRNNGKIGFSDYLNGIRCNNAILKIANGTSFTEAAYSSGFGSVRNFNRVFKKIYGCTPSAYFKKSD